ncbi:rhodanese-like domain-containing protein [bacterium]|nr:rhodanese-like domain-containing protein [bacterium]
MRTGLPITVAITVIITIVLIVAYRCAVSSPLLIAPAAAREQIAAGQVDVILDVRTELERATLGYYPGSVHIAGADIDAEFPVRFPARSVRTIVYCNTGQRARAAAEKLQRLGYQNVRYIAGGYGTLIS